MLWIYTRDYCPAQRESKAIHNSAFYLKQDPSLLVYSLALGASHIILVDKGGGGGQEMSLSPASTSSWILTFDKSFNPWITQFPYLWNEALK